MNETTKLNKKYQKVQLEIKKKLRITIYIILWKINISKK